ncbi:hypothetical protein FT663_00089 [Candidozyma haemuli var. vulneris]|uniref:CSC1/OSCA1-like 7TM region domain-containing protein n=1 Tax=Candidozyma haemuli TaxID=45357 RepID=A0A2V1AYG5_9ASCO|nr:hypothetical protein CXQ85_000876 [[Candida] haemuloni]KAF3994069.1 hypothetical protein FT662_00255 [[Candida] haemuloni var. vulneris]KAF3995866.1 hypothetical protein FT663_00089 [[Candida] haemuloni var. vulneris]PVH21881.1 hypothetical protein CXQ85_000876 [[Candida] haemuloni]
MAEADTQSTSTSAVLVTLVSNSILLGSFVAGFLILRLKFKRIYSPKSSFDLVPEEKKPDPLPADPVRWIFVLLTKPHSFILQQCGMDGYFFLRYLIMCGLIFLFGMLTWIILLPVNATNGHGHEGLDQLSFANVANPRRYYAHAFMSWFFYGGVIYMIYRELFFFNSLRASVLSSPRYANKLASRTVLFQSVPDAFLDEKQFMKLFNGVKRIYVSRNVRLLAHKVRQRENMAMQLEAATTKLLVTGMKAKKKADKKGIQVENPDDISSYVPEKKRPRVKEGGFFSKKIDKIEHCRQKLQLLNAEVRKHQKLYRHAPPKNSLFVEFEDQYSAQLAYQTVIHHNPMRMSPAYIGHNPEDIDWDNMRLFWWERITRKLIASAIIIALIIFWAIPVAFVGVISNVNNLTEKLPWLGFIQNLPDWLLGVVTGLLPTIMLSLLMTILPMFIRAMAKIAGCVSFQTTEDFTQNCYYGFLVVNSFLVTALASSATAAVAEIINNPASAMTLLAANLPRSSNFFISYLILQGFTIAGGALFQVVTFFLFYILGAVLDKTLRKKWERFSGLGLVMWGTTFPLFTNLATITLAFAIIAPMILLFGCVAFLLAFIAYGHNLTYCFIEAPDNRGMHYPRALFHTFTGLYLGQVCLLGLFVVGKGWGCVALQAIGIAATAFCHHNLLEAFGRLTTVLPIDCMKPLDGFSQTVSCSTDSDFKRKVLDKNKANEPKVLEEDKIDQARVEEETGQLEGGHNLVPLLADRDFKTTESKNWFVRFVRPDVFLNFRHAKRMIPATYNMEEEVTDDKHAYDQPAIAAQMPKLWIPRDPYGWSRREIEDNEKIIEVTDENSGFSDKCVPQFFGEAPL